MGRWCAANTKPFPVKDSRGGARWHREEPVFRPLAPRHFLTSCICRGSQLDSRVPVKDTWDSCNGCTDPSAPTPTSTPAPSLMCSSWCAANTNPFSVKVTWAECNGCAEEASTPRRLGKLRGFCEPYHFHEFGCLPTVSKNSG